MPRPRTARRNRRRPDSRRRHAEATPNLDPHVASTRARRLAAATKVDGRASVPHSSEAAAGYEAA
eukprot:5360009-Prymnesium_polylepis.1